MTVDPTPVLAAAALIGLVVSGHVSVTTVLRRSDASALAWSSGFLAASGAAVIGCVTTLTGAGTAVAWAAVAGLVCYAPGALWSGVREFDELPGSVLPGVGVASVAAFLSVLLLPIGPGLAIAGVVGVVLSVACARALAARAAGVNLDTRIAAVACAAHAVACLAVSGVALAGAEVVPPTLLVAWWVLALAGLLTPATALSFYGMQALRSAGSSLGGRPDDTALRVLDRPTFVAVAQDRLSRVDGRDSTGLSVVVATVADLEEIRVVYGSEAARLAVALVGDVLRRLAPVTSDVGHLGGASFGVLSVVAPGLPAPAVEEAVSAGLFEEAASPRVPVRVACTFETATTAGETGSTEAFERLLGRFVPGLSRS